MKNYHNTRSSRRSVKNIQIIQGGQDLTAQAGLIPVVKLLKKHGFVSKIEQTLDSKSYGAETLTVVYANPENDRGDPKEVTTRYNSDQSWHAEIDEFARCIVDDRQITNGTSEDALQTMKLVYKIYYSDPVWRDTYNIENPDLH